MKKKEKSDKKMDILSNLVLDTEGETNEADDTETDADLLVDEVPAYDTKFTGYLTDKEFSTETGKLVPNDSAPKKTCFNCLGNHNISECPQERDYAEIARNRKMFMANRTSSNKRYHEIDEARFGQFQPGRISKNLRHVLGLNKHDVAPFIYRMRYLGYPPGWLKEAEVSKGNLFLFDGEGKASPHPYQEEGEERTISVRYDVEKLVTFPGFNAPLPEKSRDVSRDLGCPEMQPHHRREEFERIMTMKKAVKYKKKKTLILTDSKDDAPDVHLRGGEMEVDDSETLKTVPIEFNPPLPDEAVPPPLPDEAVPPPPPVDALEDGETRSSESEMEDKLIAPIETKLTNRIKGKKIAQNLSSEIGESSMKAHIAEAGCKKKKYVKKGSHINSEVEGNLIKSSETEVKCKKKKKKIKSFFVLDIQGNDLRPSNETPKNTEIKETQNNNDATDTLSNSVNDSLANISQGTIRSVESDDAQSPVPKKKQRRSESKGFKLGVPIPESCTPYTQLPPSDKWTSEITDHILFDNLPDSIGTWDKMKGIMKNVKVRMQELHENDSD